jgi:hypothetical protein
MNAASLSPKALRVIRRAALGELRSTPNRERAG